VLVVVPVVAVLTKATQQQEDTMTTQKFTLGKRGALQGRFDQASRKLHSAKREVRDLTAALEAQLSLERLFTQRRWIRPQ